MKKILAALVSSLAIVALCVCLSACSTSITGTWKFHKLSYSAGGVEMNVEAGGEFMGMTISEDYMVLTVNDDNTFTMATNMGGTGSSSVDGTWEQKDGKYYFTIAGESVEFTLSGSTLTFDQEGMKVELKK